MVEAPVHFRIFKIIPGLWPLDASSNSSVEITKNNILCKSKSPWTETHCFENKDREISLLIQEKKYKKVWGQKITEYKNISKRERQYVTRKLILKSTKCNWYSSKKKNKKGYFKRKSTASSSDVSFLSSTQPHLRMTKNSNYFFPTEVLGFPSDSAGKEYACSVGDLGSNPGLGRSPVEGNSYPLQYSGLENSMGCTIQGVTNCRTRLTFTFTEV